MNRHDIEKAIIALPRDDRAAPRPWILAMFDVQGYPNAGYPEKVVRDVLDAERDGLATGAERFSERGSACPKTPQSQVAGTP